MVDYSGKLVRLFIKLFIYFWLIAQIELSLTFEKVCARFSIFAMHTLPPTPWCDYPSVRVYILLKRLIYSSLPFSRALFLTQIILIIAIPHWSRRENLIWLKYLNFASFFGPKCVQFWLPFANGLFDLGQINLTTWSDQSDHIIYTDYP